MSRFVTAVSLLALIAAGCDANSQDHSQTYHQTSTQTQIKPTVAIIPVIDNTKSDYEWNLSDELSSMLYYRLSQQGKFSVKDATYVRSKLKKLKEMKNPFGPDISWVKKAFQGDRFVIFLELVEHEEVIRQDSKKTAEVKDCSADLNMSMRIRVFDLQGNEPKVILQELVHDSHFIPRPFTQANFYQVPWGHESFNISPIGLAHAEFIKEIASRIEDYILLASKRVN